MKFTSTFWGCLARVFFGVVVLLVEQVHVAFAQTSWNLSSSQFLSSFEEPEGSDPFGYLKGPVYETTPTRTTGQAYGNIGNSSGYIVTNKIGGNRGYDGVIFSKTKFAFRSGQSYEISVYAKVIDGPGNITAYRTGDISSFAKITEPANKISVHIDSSRVTGEYKKFSFRFVPTTDVEQHIAFRMERIEKNGAKAYGKMYLDYVVAKELCREVYTVSGGGCYSGGSNGEGIAVGLKNLAGNPDADEYTEYELIKNNIPTGTKIFTTSNNNGNIPPVVFFPKEKGTFSIKVTGFKITGDGNLLPCDLKMAGSVEVKEALKFFVKLETRAKNNLTVEEMSSVCPGVNTQFKARVFLAAENPLQNPPFSYDDYASINTRWRPGFVEGVDYVEVENVNEHFTFRWIKNDGTFSSDGTPSPVENSNLSSTVWFSVEAKLKSPSTSPYCLVNPVATATSNRIYLDKSSYYTSQLTAFNNPVCVAETGAVIFTANVTQGTNADQTVTPADYYYTWYRTRGGVTVPIAAGKGNNFKQLALFLGQDDATTNPTTYRIKEGDVIRYEMKAGESTSCSNLSPTVTVQYMYATVWKGDGDDIGDWFVRNNWTRCVPDERIDALIPVTTGEASVPNESATRVPIIGSNKVAKVRSLFIKGTLQLEGILEVSGHLIKKTEDAYLDALPASTTVFNQAGDVPHADISSWTDGTPTFVTGASAQKIGGYIYEKLALSGSTKELSGHAIVKQELDVSAATVRLGNFNLTIERKDGISGFSPSRYLITSGTGRLWFLNVGAPGQLYPVGNGTSYTPASIKNNGPTANFGVRVATLLKGNEDAELVKSVKRLWDVDKTGDKTSQDNDVTLTVQWNGGDETTGFEPEKVFLSHFEPNRGWLQEEGFSFHDLTLAGNNRYSLTQTGVKNFSPFAVGSGWRNAPLPVTLSFFQAEKSSADALLTWETASEKNNQGFGVEVSTDGETFRSLGFVKSQNGNAQREQRYSFRDTEKGKFGTRYYRLRQTDLDGTVTFSAAKAVTFEPVKGISVAGFPNPFRQNIQLEIASDVRQNARVVLTDNVGRVVYQQEVAIEAGSNTREISLSERLNTGIYHLIAYMGDKSYRSKLVKE